MTSLLPCVGILIVTKKKVKEELKKPDVVLVTIGRAVTWAKEHARLCVIGAIVVVIAGLAVTAWGVYQAREDDKLQYQLAEGIRSFEEYNVNGGDDSLKKAESIFKGLSTTGARGVSDIAKLYLGKIYYIRGKAEDAKATYLDVKNRSSNGTLRKLAEAALQFTGVPAK